MSQITRNAGDGIDEPAFDDNHVHWNIVRRRMDCRNRRIAVADANGAGLRNQRGVGSIEETTAIAEATARKRGPYKKVSAEISN